jgi:hypothetical protein
MIKEWIVKKRMWRKEECKEKKNVKKKTRRKLNLIFIDVKYQSSKIWWIH